MKHKGPKKIKSIGQCLELQLGTLYREAIKSEQLQDKVIPLLPQELSAHFRVGSFHQGRLVLDTCDQVWASQLRYYLPELRDKLRKQGFYDLASIKINISAEKKSENNKEEKRKAKQPSQEARDDIFNESEQIDYQPLKEALQKLALRSK